MDKVNNNKDMNNSPENHQRGIVSEKVDPCGIKAPAPQNGDESKNQPLEAKIDPCG